MAKTLCSHARGPGSIPGQQSTSRVLLLKDPMCHAATKTRSSRVNKNKYNEKYGRTIGPKVEMGIALTQ